MKISPIFRKFAKKHEEKEGLLGSAKTGMGNIVFRDAMNMSNEMSDFQEVIFIRYMNYF